MSWFDVREQVSTWTHFAWMLLSLPATYLLWRKCRGDRVRQFTMLVYGFSMTLCYLGSALFHSIHGDEELIEGVFGRLDAIGIFLLIAGTVTPAAVVVLRGPWRWFTLITTWGAAFTGITLRLLPIEQSRHLYNAIYLGMGWGGALCYFELARTLTHRSLRFVVLGGVLYSVGAVVNWIGAPVLWPGVFGAHELFHVFVMAATVCHYWFMLNVVVPYSRPVFQEDAEPAFGLTTERGQS